VFRTVATSAPLRSSGSSAICFCDAGCHANAHANAHPTSCTQPSLPLSHSTQTTAARSADGQAGAERASGHEGWNTRVQGQNVRSPLFSRELRPRVVLISLPLPSSQYQAAGGLDMQGGERDRLTQRNAWRGGAGDSRVCQ